MEANANTLVRMGIISREVYNEDYFNGKLTKIKANGTTYKVLKHTGNYTISGFNALLLQDTSTGKYTIAFRGTEPTSVMDWVTNIQTGIDNYSPQFNDALAFVQNILKTKDKGYDVSTKNLTLTGHSLGGILTQAVGATLQIPGYAYNPWGADVLATLAPDNIQDRLSQYLQRAISGSQVPNPDLVFAKKNIFNVSFQDDGFLNGDILSNLATGILSEHLGTFIPIWGANGGLLYGHDIKTLIPAIKHANKILDSFSLSTTYKDLSDAYTSSGYEKAEKIFNDLDIYNAPKRSLNFDFYINKTLTQLNQTNKADLYALINLNPFAIEGNLTAYKDIDVKDYSNTYLEKRSEMLYYTMHPKSKNTGNGTYYQDETLNVHTQDKLMVNYANGKSSYVEFGTDGKDDMVGFNNDDYLFGGKGDDTLVGQGGDDYLEGGSGFDTYISGDGDTINDSDGKGKILFKDIDLTGRKKLNKKTNLYEDKDKDFTYKELNGNLIITAKDGKSITIKEWKNKQLGIELVKNDDIEISITESNSANEGNSGTQSMSFTLTLSRALEDGESLTVAVSNTKEGTYTFSSGESSKTFTHTWKGDTVDEGSIDHTATLTPTVVEYKGESQDVKVTVKNSGKATVYDDDDDNRYDPLVLDTNKDGFISTTSLENSNTYFDLTGDGLKERVGWIKPEDGLLVYDKNENGQIDGIDEVFGNLNKSGFEELKELIDSNHDNKIDRKDELYNQLQVWNDLNGDAKVQKGELRTLSQADIKSIDLNIVETNIEINGNVLTEASKYTDSKGNKELVADVQLATDVKDTKVDIADIPDFTIDESTRELPTLKGSGLVYDAFIRYNIDPEFKAVAKEMSTNMTRVATQFDSFIEQYSGYTAYVNKLRQKYSVENFEMSEADKQTWILERFEAVDVQTSKIENYYNTNLNNQTIPTKSVSTDNGTSIKYNSLKDNLESTFALQSVFKDAISSIHYENDKIVVDNQTTLHTQVTDYFNSDKTIQEKLYLAKVMHMQHNSLGFDIDTIIASINNNIEKEMIRYIYLGNDAAIFQTQTTLNKGLFIGSDEDEIITADKETIVMMGKGDDKVIAGNKNNEFYFRRGDGSDAISDSGGVDKLLFETGINRDDVIIKLNRNNDLIIALKDGDKPFEELSDKVTIVDWMKSANRVEVIEFGDGSTLKFQDVFDQFEATNRAEIIQLSSGNDILDTKDGNDVIKAMGGNDKLTGGKGDDRLEGGVGNDRYYYAKGDGKDIIYDIAGHDTLQFKEGISIDDLQAKFVGSDLLIALKEDGKTFEQLSDVITIKNYKNSNNAIESIYLAGFISVSIDKLLNQPTEDNDTLIYGNENNSVDLLAGDDDLTTGSGNDTISGGSGNDTIRTQAGDDTLKGGAGDDTLEGGAGDDTYIFNLGDGKDTIYDNDGFGFNNSRSRDAGDDTLRFGEGITKEDLMIKYHGADLLIGIKDGDKSFEELSDVVTIKDYLNLDNSIEQILFFDGAKLEVSTPREGTDGRDTIDLRNETTDISLRALAGIDFVHTGSGNDNVHGGSGADDIYTGAGDDTLTGGSSDDLLVGGSGNDTYIYNRGDGTDIIIDDNRPEVLNTSGLGGLGGLYYGANQLVSMFKQSSTTQIDAGNDTLKFGEGITKEDISYQISGNDLIVHIANSGNITIKEYFNTDNSIENFVLNDGTELEAPKITTGDDIYTFSRGDGLDTIIDSGGNDKIKFETGINQNDLIGKLIGNDFIIALKENGKTFEELSDKITIKNYLNNSHKIETIEFNDGTSIKTDSLLVATEGDDNLVFGNDDVTIDLLGGNDTIKTGSGDDTLQGGAGSDTIKSGLGSDTITGGKGDDNLQGGHGDDTYIFNLGDGKDIIEDSSGNDVLKFGKDIAQEDVIVRLIGQDLIVALKENGKTFEELSDKITIKNYLNNSHKIETIEFNDGTSVKTDSLLVATEGDDNLVFENDDVTIDLLGGNDTIKTGSGDDTLKGGAGDDIIDSGAGADTLQGGAGSDTIKSGLGSDTITGGKGDDNLQGGHGDDTYIFNLGDGKDIIEDISGNDVLKFGKDIAQEDVIVRLIGQDLIVALKENGKTFEELSDKITLKNYTNSNNKLETIMFDDGTSLSVSTIDFGTDKNDNFIFGNTNTTINAKAGDDIVVTGTGNDTITGGKGDDNLQGGHGDDTYIFNLGDGKDIIEDSSGNDVLKFGKDITQEDVIVRLIGQDLIVALKENGKTFEELSNKITIKNYLYNSHKIETIEFNDGTSRKTDSLLVATEGDDNLVFGNDDVTIDLLGGNDTIKTGSGDDTLKGGAGDDIIDSGAGADTLQGGAGSDTIKSGLGADTITGGKGDDNLQGGHGDDTYVFNKGDGKDSLTDSGGIDVIKFGSGITQNDLLFKQDGNNLIIALKVEGKIFTELDDKITIKDWFKNKTNIESIKFSDNSIMKATQIATMVLSSQPDTLFSNHGATMHGGFGDDTYVYKKDDFTVIIDDKYTNKEIAVNAGDDTLRFENINRDNVTIGVKGNDLIIKIDIGHDTYTELKDYVVIRNWRDANKGIESIIFGDGEVLNIDKKAVYPPLEFDENWITSRYYIYGNEDNNIEGTDFSEIIESGAGDDTIIAKDGNDQLVGGTGNDTLYGGKGNDTYVFNRGDGEDTVIDSAGVDTLRFGQNITRDDLIIKRVENNLVMAIKEDGKTLDELTDKVILTDWFNEESIDNRVELLVIDGNSAVAIADFIITPTQGDDNLEYGDENNIVDALGGNDTIHMGGGNDTIVGGSGDDNLYGEDGDDTISGDAGVDTLYGAEGNDTYVFGRGDGKDTIIEDNFSDWGRTGEDKLKFKDGISADDLIIVQDGDDLIVGLKEDGKTFAELSDKITLKKWSMYDDENSRDYSRAYFAVEVFSFADGSTWNMSDIIAHIGSDESETIQGYNNADTLEGKKGDDTLKGHLGDDTYVFNRGDGRDTIYDYGRKGDDYSYYNAGNDTLKLGKGIKESELYITKYDENDDITIAIHEDGKTFDEYSDTITIKDWFKTNNRVENLVLSDGTQINLVKYLNAGPTSKNDKLVYGNSDDIVDALAGDDVIIAQGGDDYVDGNTGNDHLEGGAGSDTLIGNVGDDTLIGGLDDDRLEGGEGNDTYIFNLGDGHDTISDYSVKENEIDKLVFGNDIDVNKIKFTRRENDLTITIDENNTIKVENWFLEGNYKLEKLTFTDGTVLNSDDVENRVTYYGDENDNVMVGTNNSEKAIYGYQGNDTITGNGGDDTLIGGLDDDRLEGGEGNDTYIFNLGDGHDTISDYSVKENEIDKLVFGNDIDVNKIKFTRRENNLIITIDENNTIKVENWFLEGNYKLEEITFTDGTVLNSDDVENKIDLNKAPEVVPQVREQQVNTYTHHSQNAQQITALNDGGYVITWESAGQDGSGSGVYLQQYDSSGEKVGVEQQVNTYIEHHQEYQKITALNNGGYVITWESNGQDGSGFGVYLQQYDSSGQKVGVEQQVNTYTQRAQYTQQITALNNGGYVITWDSSGQDGSRFGIYLQQYDSSGEKVGVEQQVNTYTEDDQKDPQITALNDGGYVITWDSIGQDGSDNGVYLQQYDSSGEKVGVEQQVGTYEGYFKDSSSGQQITALNDGGYVITWESFRQDGSNSRVYLQQYDSSGEKVGVEQQVNTYTENSQSNPQITALNDGGYVITWDSIGQDGSDNGVYLQQYDSSGEKVGVEQQVNTYTVSDQRGQQITALNDGGYVITWDSIGQDGSDNGVYLQQYDSSGEKVGVEQQVNTYTTGKQKNPQITALNDGGYVITWISNWQDGSGSGVYSQQYDANGNKMGNKSYPLTSHWFTSYDVVNGKLDYIQDPNGDKLSYSATVTKGTFTINESGHWTYEPKREFDGTVEANIVISDGRGGVLKHTLTFNIGSYYSPLVLDIDGDGITSTSLVDSPTYFDYNGDGIKEKTAWTDVGDAQLVADLNHDGKISDGSEIFGEYTKLKDGSLAKNGYAALAQYDTNGDGIIDKRDEAFGNLSLWFDKNQNGKSEEGELVNIQLSQVTAIYLDGKNGITFKQRRENGNVILNETNYESTNGNGIIRDVGFKYDATDTITNNDTLDKKYYGETLSGKDGDDTYLFNLGTGKITIDDNGNGNDKVLFADGIVPEQLLVKWDKASGDLIIGIKESIDDSSSITEVTNQIRIKNWFEQSGSIESFEFANGKSLTKESLYNILLNTKEERSLTARVLEDNGVIEGGTFSDLLYGSNGEETLRGLDGNDYLKGLAGDDLLEGGSGDDTLNGGVGDDTLNGGSGNDLYIYNKGDGKDLLNDFLGKDTISFGEGISKDTLIIEVIGNNLVLGIKDGNKTLSELSDTITIENWNQPGFGIESLEFYDGSILTIQELFNQVPILENSELNIEMQDLRTLTQSFKVTDPDGDTLSYTLKTKPTNGTLTLNANGSWSYKATGTFIGVDYAIVQISDGNGGVVEQTLNFDMKVTAPTLDNVTSKLNEDTNITDTLQVNNPVGGTLIYEIVENTDNGNFNLNTDGSYSYTPNENYNGSDEVRVKVTNEYGLSTTVTLDLTITPVNDAPELTDSSDESHILKNTRIVTGSLEATDIDGDTLKYTIATNPIHGTLSIDENGNWSYESEFGYVGDDHVVLSVNDGNGGSITKEYNFTSKGLIYEGGDLTINEQNIGNTLELGNTNMDSLSFSKSNDDLLIKVKDQGTITLSDYFTTPEQNLTTLNTSWGKININKEVITEASGSWWNWRKEARANEGEDTLLVGTNSRNKLVGSTGDDILFGYSINDNLYGGDGKDTLFGGDGYDSLYGQKGDDILFGGSSWDRLFGGEGDDQLIGGSGNDELYGNEGNDTLSGGIGYDWLQGGTGDDTYYVNSGDGHDNINDMQFNFWSFSFADGGDDTLKFGVDVQKEDISFIMNDGNLLIKYGDGDTIKIHGQSNDKQAIEKFELSDGSFITSDNIENIIQEMSAYATDKGIDMSSQDNIRNNEALMQIVTSGWQSA